MFSFDAWQFVNSFNVHCTAHGPLLLCVAFIFDEFWFTNAKFKHKSKLPSKLFIIEFNSNPIFRFRFGSNLPNDLYIFNGIFKAVSNRLTVHIMRHKSFSDRKYRNVSDFFLIFTLYKRYNTDFTDF